MQNQDPRTALLFGLVKLSDRERRIALNLLFIACLFFTIKLLFGLSVERLVAENDRLIKKNDKLETEIKNCQNENNELYRGKAFPYMDTIIKNYAQELEKRKLHKK